MQSAGYPVEGFGSAELTGRPIFLLVFVHLPATFLLQCKS